jgi:Flp pilus assembly CpaF family ATPase
MNNTLLARQHAMLEHALGPVVRAALALRGTVEVMVNDNGTIWHEVHGAAAICIGSQEPRVTEATIRLVASCNGQAVHADAPSLAGTLPGGQRFQGFLPPRTKAPAYCIRVPQAQVLTRADYVPQCCSAETWAMIAQAVTARDNIILCGGMSSGKTTLANALARLITPGIRVCTMEDIAELSVTTPNQIQLYTSANADLHVVAKEGFRTAAQRILVGEIRDGWTAINTFKLWLAVGGGICTTHADSARDALMRLEYLCAEVSPGQYQLLLGDVIDLIVFLEVVEGRRLISEVVRVHTWKEGNYVLETLFDRGRTPDDVLALPRSAA